MKSIKKILLPLFTYFILLTSCEPATSSSLGESSDNDSNDISTSIGGSEDNDSSVEDSNGSDSNYGSSKAIYNLYTARLTDDNNKVDEQVFNWGDGEVVVLFNSENLLTGQTISAPLSLESHRLVIVQHH